MFILWCERLQLGKKTGEEREKKEIYIYILYIQNYIVDTEW